MQGQYSTLGFSSYIHDLNSIEADAHLSRARKKGSLRKGSFSWRELPGQEADLGALKGTEERAQNADFRRKLQIFADSPPLLEIQAFGGRRKSKLIFGKGMRTATFQFSESGASVNGPDLFTELPFL